MEFFRPQFLYGLFFLAIPIIVHLFNFRRTKKIYFSNLQFLKEVKDASSSKLKLKHLLILLSRLLFITALVFAFAQPYFPASSETSQSSQVIIYLDNSHSMTIEPTSGPSAINTAINSISKLINTYPKETEYQLITNKFDAFSSTFHSQTEIMDALAKVKPTGQVKSLSEIFNRISQKEISDTTDVYLFSDFQQAIFQSKSLLSNKYFKIHLIPVFAINEENILIDSVYIDNPFMLGKNEIKLNTIITNVGKNDKPGVSIKVFVSDNQVGTAQIDLPAKAKKTVAFDIAIDLSKQHEGRIVIEDYPVTFDNILYFVTNINSPVKVLVINDENSNNYLSAVYNNPDLFEVQNLHISNLNYSLINNYNLVVLNELNELSPSLFNILKNNMKNGGKILIIPSLNMELGVLQSMGIQKVNNSLKNIPLAKPDLNNPFFDYVFEQKDNRISMPEASPIFDLGVDRNAILSFQDNHAFLKEFDNGMFIIASPLNPAFTNFQTHGLFVPIMYKIAFASSNKAGPLYHYTSDDFFKLTIDSLSNDQVVRLVNDQVDIIPNQRSSSGSITVEIPKNSIINGFYQIKASEIVFGEVAFNLPQEESKLQLLSDNQLIDIFGEQAIIIHAENERQFESAIRNRYEGRSLWKLALIFALVFLFGEVLLIRFFP